MLFPYCLGNCKLRPWALLVYARSVLWLWACKLYEGQAIHPHNFFWSWSIYRCSLWSCTVKHPPAGEQLMKGCLRSMYIHWRLINSHTWSYKQDYSCGLSYLKKLWACFFSCGISFFGVFFVNAQGWLQKGLNIVELTIWTANKILGSKQAFTVNPGLDTQLFASPVVQNLNHLNVWRTDS